MKKSVLIIAALLIAASVLPLSALTYENNEFQRRSKAYSELAVKAFDDGDYDASAAYAEQAERFAEESAAFIERMIARSEAEAEMNRARTRLAWAKEAKAERNFPAAYSRASEEVDAGGKAFDGEDYPAAKGHATRALEALASVRDVVPLPAYYKVGRWVTSRDCLWNIAANPAVYGNPFLWVELYKANKRSLKRPSDPNLLMPGMVVEIPSLKGEYREGTYDPSVKYESFKSQTK